MDKDFINVFLYDILINSKEREKIFSSSKFISCGKLISFVRVFNIERNGIAIPNIDKSDLLQFVNGIVVSIPSSEFYSYCESLENCEIVEVDIKDYDENELRASLFRFKHFEASDFNFNSKEQIEYFNNFLEGGKEFGEDFYEDLELTTYVGRERLNQLDLD